MNGDYMDYYNKLCLECLKETKVPEDAFRCCWCGGVLIRVPFRKVGPITVLEQEWRERMEALRSRHNNSCNRTER